MVYLIVHIERGSEIIDTEDEQDIISKYLPKYLDDKVRVFRLYDRSADEMNENGKFEEVATTYQ